MKKISSLLLLLQLCIGVAAQSPDSLTFAVLGNSISTYYDYLPAGYAVYYTQDREKSVGFQVGDTWWMQLSRMSGLTFLANASWSGSRVAADELNSNAPFLSNHRVKALGRAGNPDLIFIAGGTNDWNVARVPLGEYRTSNFTDSVSFRGAYQRLLYKLTTRYPQARIVCLSIFPRGNGVNDKNAKGWSQADANASIRHIAQQFGQTYIDCTGVAWGSNWDFYTLDRLHPSAAGSTLLARHIYNALISQKVITRALKRTDEVEEAERLLDISFTADGIVNNGTYDACKVGKHGGATTFYDAARNVYYGCTKAKATDYFYATYDEGSPLAEAFNRGVTWEMLVRLDGLADHSGSISRTCILGNEANGGWVFYNSELASCFSYANASGVRSTMKSIVGDSILLSGKFYHLVVTMDRTSHVMRYFINGKLVCTGTRAGTDMALPQCGSPKGRKNMWICLGGDAVSGTFTSGAENSSACSFVFARIYDGALSQKAAQSLYSDEVRRFTESPAGRTELFLDCEFTPDGTFNHAPFFRDKSVVMMGEVPVSYNPDINLYEAKFSRTRTQFFKYLIGDSPDIMSQLSDAYSVEVFCRISEALPAAAMRPLGFTNGYGFGLQMNNKGNIGYATTTQGSKADGTYAKTQWTWIGAGTLTADYTHYVIVYDRKGCRSQLYINGQLADTRSLTFKECPVYEWAPSTWLAIGGDASGNYGQSTSVGSYSFDGDVALVRIYGRALSQDEVRGLDGILRSQEMSYTTGTNGYVAVCLPYTWQVPEDCTAYIATEIASPSLMLTPVAEAGERVPYGTPVLLKGPAKTSVTLPALNKSEVDETLDDKWSDVQKANLLVGVYPGKSLEAGEGYFLKAAGNFIYRATVAVSLPPFSCYLPSDEKRTYLKLEETIDGISECPEYHDYSEYSEYAGAIYDLRGRKVKNRKSSNPQLPKGIYIFGGRKIIVK